MIVVNFKTYKEATGYKAILLARTCKRIQEETKIRIVAVPQVADLRNCVETGAECWVQHVDPVEQGKNTGWITVEDVEEAGAVGSLLNHAEHKLEWATLEKTMSVIAGKVFVGCVCAADLEEAKKVINLKPDFVAYEPPELIGDKTKSVASEKPDSIKQIVEAVKVFSEGKKPGVLVGAGIHSVADIKTGLELGAMGVLLATDVVLSENPEESLRELVNAFR